MSWKVRKTRLKKVFLATTGDCTIDLRQDGNLPDIAPILTTYHQDWVLPTADAKITLEQGSVMRISCPGFGFSNEDLRNSQFQETKYVTMFENHWKSLIQHCERSELRLHIEWTKAHQKCQKMVNFGDFLKIWSLRSFLIEQKSVENAKIEKF